MVKFFLHFLVKIAFSFVIWVFILSIRWDGQTLYDRSHEILVDNSVVAMIETRTIELWEDLLRHASSKYAELEPASEDKIKKY